MANTVINNGDSIIGKLILLTEWDWPDQNRPKAVKGRIEREVSDDTFFVKLESPLRINNGPLIYSIIISSRHKGYRIVRAFPKKNSRILSAMFFILGFLKPLIAVNVYSEDGEHISIANLERCK